MKKLFAVAAVISACIAANAQNDEKSYTRAQISFTPITLTGEVEAGESVSIDKPKDPTVISYTQEMSLKGITLGLIHGKKMSKTSLPIYIESGLTLTWAHNSDGWAATAGIDDDFYDMPSLSHDDYKFNYLNASIPVNGVYRYKFSNGIGVEGHLGLNFKVNIVAKEESTEEHSYYSLTTTTNWLKGEIELSSPDADDDDLGTSDMSDDMKWNRFQLGGNLGLGASYKQFYLGWQLQGNFMKLCNYEDISTTKEEKNYFGIYKETIYTSKHNKMKANMVTNMITFGFYF